LAASGAAVGDLALLSPACGGGQAGGSRNAQRSINHNSAAVATCNHNSTALAMCNHNSTRNVAHATMS
jgi:hypothetical protein